MAQPHETVPLNHAAIDHPVPIGRNQSDNCAIIREERAVRVKGTYSVVQYTRTVKHFVDIAFLYCRDGHSRFNAGSDIL